MKEASSLIFYDLCASGAKNRLTELDTRYSTAGSRGDLEGAVLSSPAIYKSKYYKSNHAMTEILYVRILIYFKG